MNKIYQMGSSLLLILLTGTVAIGPGLYETARLNALVQEKNVWKYEVMEQSEFSSVHFISQWIRFGNLKVVAYDLINYQDESCPTDDVIRKESQHVINQAFHDQKDTLNYLSDMLSKNIGDYSKEFFFSYEQTNPMFLNIASVCFDDEGRSMTFAYEENTDTLMELGINFFGDYDDRVLDDMEKALRSYYEETLLLKSGEYVIIREKTTDMYYLYAGLRVSDPQEAIEDTN